MPAIGSPGARSSAASDARNAVASSPWSFATPANRDSRAGSGGAQHRLRRELDDRRDRLRMARATETGERFCQGKVGVQAKYSSDGRLDAKRNRPAGYIARAA